MFLWNHLRESLCVCVYVESKFRSRLHVWVFPLRGVYVIWDDRVSMSAWVYAKACLLLKTSSSSMVLWRTCPRERGEKQTKTDRHTRTQGPQLRAVNHGFKHFYLVSD